MPRKIDRQREIDQFSGNPVTAGDIVNSAIPTAGPAVPTQAGPSNLTVSSNILMFSAVTPLALVGLTWEPAIGLQAATHLVEAATNSGFTTGVVRRTVVTGQLSAALELPTGTVYYFRVQAHTQFVTSAWSNTVSTTTATDTSPPAVPTALAAVFNAAGDLEISWTNPTSANFRDVEVSIYADSGFTTLLYRTYDASQRIVWTASQNRQAGGGTPDPAVFVRMASRSWAGVLSTTAVPSTQPVKAVPANVSSLTQSWSGDAGTASADLVVTWAVASGASFYRLSIDGVSRDVFGTRFVYNVDQNRVEHSGTPDPVLSLSIIGVDGLDQVSATPTTTTATNAAPAAPGGITLTAFFSTIAINTTSVLPADGLSYRFRLIQTSPSASDITWDSPSSLQTRAIDVAATYQVGVKMVDVFGQAGAETLSSTAVADALTLADLRAAARYSDSLVTSPATLKSTLSDGVLSGVGGGTVPTFVAATTIAIANSATSVNQTPPTGVAEKDIMIAHVIARGDSQTITTPSGWTIVSSTPTTDGSYTPDVIHALFWREAAADETSAYTFNVGSSNTLGVVIAVFRDCDLTTPINANDDQVNASSTTITAPTITTTVNNALLVFFNGSATTQATSPNGGLTECWEQSGGTNTVNSYGATETFATAGATGTRTATYASARASTGLLLALAPTAGGTAITYASNASWVRWIRFERDLLERYKTVTLAMNPTGGTSTWYLRTSTNGSTWAYWSGPVTSGRIITSVADASAAQTAAISSATLGKSTASRVDLPSVVEARYIEVWVRNTTANTDLAEYYPRRLVQSDDIEAESIKAINIAAATITADRLSVAQLSAITADMGTITAGTITGATIQTATSGARIELTSANGLRSYNSSNVLQTQLRTSDGALLAGTVQLDANGLFIPTANVAQSGAKLKTSNGGALYGTQGTFLSETILEQINGQSTSGTTQLVLRGGLDTAPASITLAQTEGSPRTTSVNLIGTLNAPDGIDVGVATGAAGGVVKSTTSDAATTTRTINVILDHQSSGTPAAGFGVEIGFKSESSTTNSRDLATISARWATATDASRKSEVAFLTYDNTSFRVPLLMGTDGSNATIGFLNNSAIARQTVSGSRGGNAALASLLTALASFGLITDSST